jgi:sulfur carrier protein ThiS adenylyltransferase
MNGTRETFADRDIRQRALVPPDRLAGCQAMVVGVGAIGRQVAIQLASVGLSDLILIDPDTVQVENLAPQGYWPEDLGRQKVEATAALCRRINPDLQLTMLPERFRRSMIRRTRLGTAIVVFTCVDAITSRRFIWQTLVRKRALLIDGRMSGEVLRVLAAELPNDRCYGSTLFDQNQAHLGACTARSTNYSAAIAAGLMVSQFAKWLRGLPLEVDLTLNLLSADLVATGPGPRTDSGLPA